MSLQRIDLNLFRVFEAILQHRSVTGAAKMLGVTPSAVSHALSRLRRSLDDELFVHGDDGMEPTARALELAPSIRDGLGRIDDALAAKPFVPSDSTRAFRISATDYGAVTLLPGLIRRLCEVAPQVELRVFPCNRTDVVRHLDEGRIDLVIGWFAVMVIVFHWARVVWARTSAQLEAEAELRKVAAQHERPRLMRDDPEA